MDAATVSMLITGLTPVLAPLAVNFIKKTFVGSYGWLLPVICLALGIVLEVVNRFATGGGVGIIWGAALGASGVALREVINQLKSSKPDA